MLGGIDRVLELAGWTLALMLVIMMFVALLVVILFLNRPEVEGVEEFIAEEKRRLGPLSVASATP